MVLWLRQFFVGIFVRTPQGRGKFHAIEREHLRPIGSPQDPMLTVTANIPRRESLTWIRDGHASYSSRFGG